MSKMSPLELGEKLGLPEETLDALKNLKIPEETAVLLKTAFEESPEAFEIAARKQQDCDLLVLGLYLRWAMDTHFLYAIRGISWDIFFNTLRDLTDSCRRFRERTGQPGLDNWAWVGLGIKMQVFRLAGLTFRPGTLDVPLAMGEQSYPAGTRILDVYLPDGMAPDDDTDQALAEAKEFFLRYYRQEYELFLCHSSTFRTV